jgi:hypothetical protein
MIFTKLIAVIFIAFLSQSLLAQSFFTLDSTKNIEFKNPSFDGEKVLPNYLIIGQHAVL